MVAAAAVKDELNLVKSLARRTNGFGCLAGRTGTENCIPIARNVAIRRGEVAASNQIAWRTAADCFFRNEVRPHAVTTPAVLTPNISIKKGGIVMIFSGV